jgi:hypothetical protein
MKEKSESTHKCFDSADEFLAKDNTRLSFAMELPSGRDRLVVGSEKLSARKKGKPKMVLATFCPFCGIKYLQE